MAQLRRILKPLVSGKRVLHVGCVGTLGHDPAANFQLHRHLAGLSQQIFGIDINAEGIEQMRQAGFAVLVADAETFQSPDLYDVVLVPSVLQFCQSPLGVLQNLKGALRTEGAMVVTVPNAYSPYNLYWEIFKSAQPKRVQPSGQSATGEIHLFSSSTLSQLLAAADLPVERVARCHSKPAWSSQSSVDGLYNLFNYAPGVLFRFLLPTLVGIGRRRG